MTVFPRDETHRLIGPDLATFLDRFTERVIALGDGAHASVEVGTFHEKVSSFVELSAAIDRGREHGQAAYDLDVRLWGLTREDYARYVGARTASARFQAFVLPQRMGRGGALQACWRLTFEADGLKGLGERFVNESRRLSGSTFFTMLEGTARTALYEWHGS